MRNAAKVRSFSPIMHGLIIGIALTSTGCSISKRDAIGQGTSTATEVTNPVTAQVTSEGSPVTVTILSEQRVDETLSLLARITPVVPWPEGDVVLELTGLKDGTELGSATFSLVGKSANGLLQPARVVDLPIAVTAPEMTDYRLDVLWGEAARKYSARRSARESVHREIALAATPTHSNSMGDGAPDGSTPTAPNLPEAMASYKANESTNSALTDVRLSDSSIAVSQPTTCPGLPVGTGNRCPVEFLYRATLSNLSPRVVNDVTLAARFVDGNGVAGDPSEVQLEQLFLQPGASQTIAITFEAPEGADGRSVSPKLSVSNVTYQR